MPALSSHCFQFSCRASYEPLKKKHITSSHHIVTCKETNGRLFSLGFFFLHFHCSAWSRSESPNASHDASNPKIFICITSCTILRVQKVLQTCRSSSTQGNPYLVIWTEDSLAKWGNCPFSMTSTIPHLTWILYIPNESSINPISSHHESWTLENATHQQECTHGTISWLDYTAINILKKKTLIHAWLHDFTSVNQSLNRWWIFRYLP